MSRPPKSPDDKRNANMPVVRVTLSERIQIEAEAARSGITISELLRRKVLTAKIEQPQRTMPPLSDLHAELGPIGKRINEAARLAHMTETPPPDLSDMLTDLHAVLARMGAALDAEQREGMTVGEMFKDNF